MEAKDWAYAAGILVTFVLGAWNFVHLRRAARKAGFVKTVTNQRVIWIEQLRQDMSRFIGLTHTWAMSEIEGTDGALEVLKEIDRLRYVIRLRLNPNDAPDRRIADLIKHVPDLTDASKHDELLQTLEVLTVATQEMLKVEWEKVKSESKDGDLKDM